MAETIIKIFEDQNHQKFLDGFDNFLSRIGLNNDNALSGGMYTFNFLTRNRLQLEAAFRGSWIVGQIINMRAEDMTRAGIKITSAETKHDMSRIYSQMSRLKIWQSLRSMIQWGDLYGGAIAVYQIEGQDMSTPLDISTVGINQFKGLSVFDRWQLNPDLTNLIRSGPEMGLPAYYSITTNPLSLDPTANPTSAAVEGLIKVHHTRVIRSIGIELPFFQAITEMMWGMSVLERLWDRLIAYDTATMSAANLIERANNRTIGIENLREIMSAGGQAQAGLEAQFEAMRTFQTNEGITLLDKNDNFQTSSYTFAGLADILLQFGQQVSGSAEIPLVKLFGQSPAGLSSTGESDIRNYYDSINSDQETKLRDGIDKLIKIMWRSIFGEKAPSDVEFSFTPLWQMSAMDKATIAKSTAETIIGAEEAGLIKKSVALKELRDSGEENGIFAQISDDDIKEVEEEEKDGPPLPVPESDPINQPTLPAKLADKKTGLFKKLFGSKK